MRIETKGENGKANGSLQLIWNEDTSPEWLRPSQVYVTSILPRARKGPHLHMKRRGWFHCISGKVLIRVRSEFGRIMDYILSPDEALAGCPGSGLIVKPGEAAALYNIGETEALVMNLPSPAFDPSDEHTVLGWIDPEECVCGHAVGRHDSGGCCDVQWCDCSHLLPRYDPNA